MQKDQVGHEKKKKDRTYIKRQKKDEPTYTKYVNLTVVSESESSDTETTSFTSVYVQIDQESEDPWQYCQPT